MILTIVAALAAAQAEPPMSDLRDCTVLAAVAREHLGLDKEAGPPLLPSGDYLPVCKWGALGLKPFNTAGERRNYWLRFHKPTYEGSIARVEVGIMYGTRSGHGAKCELRREGRQWRLIECGRTWVS
jgi:hypothetical protein